MSYEFIIRFRGGFRRDKKWATFQADPEWIEARRKSEEDGPLVASVVNSILAPTRFSAAK